MEFVPHLYQKKAIDFIKQKTHCALFFDMGLGKTDIVLSAIKDWLYDYSFSYKILVITKLEIAKSTWPTEVRKWDDFKSLKISKIIGDQKSRINGINADANIYLINIENLVWLIKTLKSKWLFNVVVIDESSLFKSHRSKRFKAFKTVLDSIGRLIMLSGAPTPKNVEDLWSQMFLLDRGKRLGKTITRYRTKYFVPDKRKGCIVYSYRVKSKQAEQAIYDSIKDITLSLKKEEVLKMPKLNVKDVLIDLDDNTQAKIKSFEKEFVISLKDSRISAATAGVLCGKLLQLSNGAIYGDSGWYELHDAKIKALKDIVEGSKDNFLVFYNFKHDLDRILANINCAVRYGGEETIKAWNNGSIKVLVAHPANVGYGLNMQAGGRYVIWFGLTYNLEHYIQANARLYRQGQEKEVTIMHLIAKNTIDEKVLKVLKQKDKQQNTLLEAVKMQLADSYNKTVTSKYSKKQEGKDEQSEYRVQENYI